MPRVPFHNLGIGGIVRDIPPYLLPPEVWTDGQNIRFQDNKVKSFTGEQLVFDPPTVAPYWAIGLPSTTDFVILYTGLAAIYSVPSGGAHTVRTRSVGGPYTGDATNKWNGTVIGGIPVITNGVDDPQFWATIGTGTLEDLTNWPAATSCKVIRSLQNYLVALNITESGSIFPYRIKWSHPAIPGAVPGSWDETDPTQDAGERDLGDVGAGAIVDALNLRDLLVIYKEDSIWGMQFIGGRFIFRTQIIFSDTGLMTQRCVSALPNGERHFAYTGDDLIMHNGQQIESLIDKRMKRFISNGLNQDEFAQSFTVANPLADEMWFCYPEVGSTTPNLAIVWNYKDNTIGVRDLNDARFISGMVVNDTGGVAATTWDAATGTWDSQTGQWGGVIFAARPGAISLLQVDSLNTKLKLLDATKQFNGVNIATFIERTGLAVIGVDRQDQPKADPTKRKICNRIWVNASGDPFTVKVGAQEDVGGAVTYQAGQTFIPGVDEYLDVCVQGRLLAVRFESNADVQWTLNSYALDLEVLGDI